LLSLLLSKSELMTKAHHFFSPVRWKEIWRATNSKSVDLGHKYNLLCGFVTASLRLLDGHPVLTDTVQVFIHLLTDTLQLFIHNGFATTPASRPKKFVNGGTETLRRVKGNEPKR
jgi:hypothetical protein